MKSFTFPVLSLVLALGAGALAPGCSSDDEDAAGPDAGGSSADPDADTAGSGGSTGHVVGPHEIPDSGDPGVIHCAELATYCEPFTSGSGLGHECHVTGHLGDVAACNSIYAQCIALCEPSDAGNADAH